MPPSEFWGADTWTVMDAYEGYAISKGIRLDNDALTGEEIEELKKMMEEEEMRVRS